MRRQAEGLDIEVEYEDTAHIHEPSSISSRSTPEYAAIAEAMGDTWPELDVVPGIFPAATDSRHYCSIADNVYRFQPVHLGSMGLRALHSAGESVPVEDYLRGIDFYARYLKRVCGG